MYASGLNPRRFCGVLSQLLGILAVLGAAATLGPATGIALAAGPTLAPSVLGEPPNGGGVFRFPQAVGVSPGGSTVFVGDQYSGHRAGLRRGRDAALHRRPAREPARARAPRRRRRRGDRPRGPPLRPRLRERPRAGLRRRPTGAPWRLRRRRHLRPRRGRPGHRRRHQRQRPRGRAGVAGGAAPVVYVADQGNDRVERFALDPATLTPAGRRGRARRASGSPAPQGLALDPAGDAPLRRRRRQPPRRRPRPVLARAHRAGRHFGTGPGQFQNPYDVAVDAHDPPQLYVADNLNNRVDVLDAASLGFLGTFGRMATARASGNLGDRPLGRRAGRHPGRRGRRRRHREQPHPGLRRRGRPSPRPGGSRAAGPGYVTRPRRRRRRARRRRRGRRRVRPARRAASPADGTYAGQRGLVSASTGYATPGRRPRAVQPPRGRRLRRGGRPVDRRHRQRPRRRAGPRGRGAAHDPAGLLSRPPAWRRGARGTYVADTGHGRVVLLTPDGGASPCAPASAVPPRWPWRRTARRCRRRRRRARREHGRRPSRAPGGTAWDHPAGLAVDAAGTLYVSERRPGTPRRRARPARHPGRGRRPAPGTRSPERAPAVGRSSSRRASRSPPTAGRCSSPTRATTASCASTLPGTAPPPCSTLRVAIDQLARGTVTSDLPGIACATDCRQALRHRPHRDADRHAHGRIRLRGLGRGVRRLAAAAPACSVR